MYLLLIASYIVFIHFAIALTFNSGNSTPTVSQRCTSSKSAYLAYSEDCDNCANDTVNDTAGTPILFAFI